LALYKLKKMNLIQELSWRGLLQDMMPGTEELLEKEKVTGYVGFDPTADSLHIGNLVPIILLIHLQKAGHQPIALVGGATGMVGDPSGKSQERNLLDSKTLDYNISCVKKQLEKFLDFNTKNNPALMLNNYDWFKNFSFLDFIRDIGKHITVNYMMSKDSVKNRLENGMSFTEFTYQLVQGYDFLYLFENHGCKLQMGGSDQWGNIVTGTELIRRKVGGEAFAFTAPLIKKADGGKFGKTEKGNIWLDPKKTSPYQFYQFWLNASDEDAKKYIRVFTFLPKEQIESLENEHQQAPHLRVIQKELAKQITTMVHSKEEYEAAVEASEILFGKSTSESLKKLTEQQFLDVFEGVPMITISKAEFGEGIDIVDLLSAKTGFLASNGEARRSLKENAISINKERVSEDYVVKTMDLINKQYLLLQKGKKNYFLVKIA
jgi:tyrosyl-tRNA synthetase